MINYLFTFAIITTVLNASSKHIDSSVQENAEYNQNNAELMVKLEKENIRSKILENFGIDKPPTFTKSPARLPDDVIQMLIGRQEEEPPEEAQNDLEEMFFFPINSDFECQMYDISFCQRFEYRISWNVEPLSSEFWIYKLKSWPFNNVTITVLCSHSEPNQEEFLNENITTQWTFFRLSALSDIQLREENVTCEIEVKGIVMDLNNLPFLKMMKSKVVRTRREIENGNDSIKDNGCKMIPFNVSFEDLGFGNWIIYPHVYQANTCVGYCSHVKNHHENLLMKFFKENKQNETQCDHCWFTCCRPKAFRTLELLYYESEDVIAKRNMTDMIVESCSCM